MHLRFNFDACPMYSPLGFVHLMHQNLSTSAIFCHNSLAKVSTQLFLSIRVRKVRGQRGLMSLLPGGVLNFELGTDVRPEVSTTTL